jgi:hydrogenase maturation factor
MSTRLAAGKLPPELLTRILSRIPLRDPRVLVGPGVGLDCAVVDLGDRLAVYKSDPITFATDRIGYYLVQVNANDIATTGARALWLLVTLLVPDTEANGELAGTIMADVARACAELGITVIGGHTEVTAGLERPIAVGTMIGEVARERLVTPRGAGAGDRVLLTKGVPIEAVALLARDFEARLRGALSPAEIRTAQDFLFQPGISVTRDARIALEAGRVTAMHDPTEGGLLGALWELAEASGRTLRIDAGKINVPPLAGRICALFGMDPVRTIASGALLITAPPADARAIAAALAEAGIACADIGTVSAGAAGVERTAGGAYAPWPRPACDDIAKAYAPSAAGSGTAPVTRG